MIYLPSIEAFEFVKIEPFLIFYGMSNQNYTALLNFAWWRRVFLGASN